MNRRTRLRALPPNRRNITMPGSIKFRFGPAGKTRWLASVVRHRRSAPLHACRGRQGTPAAYNPITEQVGPPRSESYGETLKAVQDRRRYDAAASRACWAVTEEQKTSQAMRTSAFAKTLTEIQPGAMNRQAWRRPATTKSSRSGMGRRRKKLRRDAKRKVQRCRR